jgi:hypothetical protein
MSVASVPVGTLSTRWQRTGSAPRVGTVEDLLAKVRVGRVLLIRVLVVSVVGLVQLGRMVEVVVEVVVVVAG